MTALLVAAPGTAVVTLAVTNIAGADPAAMIPGQTITIDVRVEAGAGDQVYGLGASVYGYDESVVDYVEDSGQSVGSIFHDAAIPGVGVFSGLTNHLVNPLVETSISDNGSRVWLFMGTGLTPQGPQPLDPGLDGVIGGGDAFFRFTFEAIAPGSSQIVIGTGYEGDGVAVLPGPVPLQATGDLIEIVVVPAAVPLLSSFSLVVVLVFAMVGAGMLILRQRSGSSRA